MADARAALSETEALKVPPHSIEAEQAVLGGLMVDNGAWDQVADRVGEADFYRRDHRLIFRAMETLAESGQPMDAVTLSEWLKSNSQLEDAGGLPYLGALAKDTPSSANIRAYADIVREKSVLRQLVEAGTAVASAGYTPEGRTSDELLDYAERTIFEIAEQSGRHRKGFVGVRDILPDVVDRIDTLYHQDGDVTGLATGFNDFDRMTSGLQNGDMVIVAGRPSMGKCVVEGSRVLDPQTGELVPIETIVRRREGRLLTLDEGLRLRGAAPSAYVDDGFKPTYRVTTALGRTIETTLTHPYLTGDGWKPLSEIGEGERIGVPRELAVFGDERMPEHKVKLLAYFIADGATTQAANPAFTNANPRLREDFERSVKGFHGVTCRTVTSGARTPSVRVLADGASIAAARREFSERLRGLMQRAGITARRLAEMVGVVPATVTYWLQCRNLPGEATFASVATALDVPEGELLAAGRAGAGKNSKNRVSLWLEDHGLSGKTALQKRIPAAVFQLPRASLALFLNRLFACDGSLFVQNERQCLLSYATSSQELARDVQHLLLRFGVLARLRRKAIKYGDDVREAWELVVSHRGSLWRFIEEVGIFGKEDRLARARSLLAATRVHSNTDSLPESVCDYVIKRKGERSWRAIYAAKNRALPHGFNAHTSAGSRRLLSRSRALELADLLDDEYLARLGGSDLYWDTVVSIEYTGIKRVYDLTVPETHSFVAEDILVHNTTFAMNIAENAAMKGDTPVAVFSMEMPGEALAMRMLSSLGRVELQKIRSGRLEDDDWPRLTSTMNLLSQAKLFIDDTPGLSPTEMRARARRLKREHGLGLILIDYLQLMQLPGSKENRAQEVSEISRALKSMAKELDVPVIALSQLNRSLEQRPNKRPVMSDLRESGAIEQDADVIIFLYRDEVYNEDSPDKGVAEIIIGKQRNGPVGTVRLTFMGQFTRFENYIDNVYGGEAWT